MFLLALGTYWSIGCSEKTAGPEENSVSLSGRHIWSKSFGDGSDQGATAVAVDASGNVIMTGYFNGTVDFGGGALTSLGGRDVFLAKFGPNGAHLWSKSFGDGGVQQAQSVAVDALENVIVTGSFYGTIDFGGDALTSAGWGDIYLAKFGPDGAHLWSKSFGDGSEQAAEAVAVDVSGNVIITGEIGGTVDFGGGALTSAGLQNIFVAKFGSDGAYIWSKRFGIGNTQISRAVGIDASGNVIITGYFRDTVNFGGGVLTSAGDADIFVAKFKPDATHLWSKRFGGEYYQYARSVAVDASENVIVAGFFESTVSFGGNSLTSEGVGEDIFVAKFNK
jgi:hypothetical protein